MIKEKQTTTTIKKKRKNKNISLFLERVWNPKVWDRFFVGTRDFFSLSHARDKMKNKRTFSLLNYSSLAQLPEDPCNRKIMLDAQRSYWGQTSFHFQHLRSRFSILLITQLYCNEKFLHCYFITWTIFTGRKQFNLIC